MPFNSVFYSLGSNPLISWKIYVKNGHIKRVKDDDIKSLVLEVMSVNCATTYITIPREPKKSLHIKHPFLVILIKNLRKFFSFEVQILDSQNLVRRFRASNYQSSTKVQTFITQMPLGLAQGWNQIQFNLADFTRRAYGTTYIETVRLQIHANCRLRRIYFTDRLYSVEELPNEYKIMTNELKPKGSKSISNPEARPSTPEKQQT